MKVQTVFLLIFLGCLLVQAGCRGAAPQGLPSPSSPNASATTYAQPSLSLTLPPTPTLTTTFTPSQTTTLRTASPTPTTTTTPSPTYAFVRDGTPLPSLEVISPENAGRLAQVARWGKGAIKLLQYAPDGKSLAVVTSEGVYFYSADKLELQKFTAFMVLGTPVAFTRLLDRLFTAGPGFSIQLWNTTTGELVQSLEQPEERFDSIHAAAVLDDGKVIFTPSQKLVLHAHSFVWDLETNQVKETAYPGSETYKISANRHTLFAHRANDLFFVSWQVADIDSNLPVIREYPLTVGPSEVSSAISANGEEVMVGLSNTLEIRLWRVSDGELLKDFSINPYNGRGQGGVLQSAVPRGGPGIFTLDGLTFSPDSKELAFITGFGKVLQYDRGKGEITTINEAIGENILYSPDGTRLVNIGGAAIFFNPKNGKVAGQLENHFAGINDLEFQPNGNLLALAYTDGNVWLRYSQDGSAVNLFNKPMRTPRNQISYSSEAISDLDFSVDGQRLFFGALDGTVWLWDLQHGVQQVAASTDWVRHVAISPDGRLGIYSVYEQGLAVFNFANQKLYDYGGISEGSLIFVPNNTLSSPTGHKELIVLDLERGAYKILSNSGLIARSPNGNLIAMGSFDGLMLKVFQSQDGKVIWDLKDALKNQSNVRPEKVLSLTFSSDGQLLAVGTDTRIFIWHIPKGNLLAILPGEAKGVTFSADGRLLGSGSYDGVVSVWAVPQMP